VGEPAVFEDLGEREILVIIQIGKIAVLFGKQTAVNVQQAADIRPVIR
jgi:hypothetical protein